MVYDTFAYVSLSDEAPQQIRAVVAIGGLVKCLLAKRMSTIRHFAFWSIMCVCVCLCVYTCVNREQEPRTTHHTLCRCTHTNPTER